MSVFGLGDTIAVSTKQKVVVKKEDNKNKNKKTAAKKDDQAAEAQAILAKMQSKEDDGECAFC